MYKPSPLRIALVVLSSHWGRVVTKPPTPPAKAHEQDKYPKKPGFSAVAFIPVRQLSDFGRIIFYVINLLEIVRNVKMLWEAAQHDTLLGVLRSHTFDLSKDFVLGVLLLAAGAYIRKACYRALGRHFTFDLSLQENHKLVTDGPYAIVRHPAYVGSILSTTGTFLFQMGPSSYWTQADLWGSTFGKGVGYLYGFLMVLSYLMVAARCSKEDEVLRTTFKEEWDRWAKPTPYRLIPYIY